MALSPALVDREQDKFRPGSSGTQSRVAVELEALFTNAGISTSANTTPSVGTTSTEILAANTNRKIAVIFNNSAAPFYIKLGSAAVVNEGIRLGPNEKLEINLTNLWKGAVNAIRAAGSANIDVFEGT